MPRILFVLFVVCLFHSSYSQDPPGKMQWFADAKLGIFIHWGIYAVDGTLESWGFHNKEVPYTRYMEQLYGFRAERYDPHAWAELIRESGARYAVITSKHHDGVALYPTRMNHLSIPEKSPAKRDVLTPFVEALKKQQLKVGLYFSLIDWSHPDYPGFLRDSARYKISDDTLRWDRFRKFLHGQVDEIITRYHPDLYWFDGDWEHDASEWQSGWIRQRILSDNPKAIINSRLREGYGDYATPEQHLPVTRPTTKEWELCMTSNDNWGYRSVDTNFKSPYQVISIFAECIGMGGNLLLDIGPRADGTIPEEEVNILKTLGRWNRKHEEAVFGTVGGLPPGHFHGPSSLSKDSTTLYLFVTSTGARNVSIKGLDNKIVSAEVLGKSAKIKPHIVGKIYWSPVPGIVYLEIPESEQDEYVTVLKLKLDGPVKLHRGKGGLE